MRIPSISKEQAIDCLKKTGLTVAGLTTFGMGIAVFQRVGLIAMKMFVEIGKLSFHNLDRNALAIIGGAFIAIHLFMLGVYFSGKVLFPSDANYVTLYFRSFTLLEFVAIRPID